MKKAVCTYTGIQKFVSVILLVSVLLTTISTGLLFDGLFDRIVGAQTEGEITSFIGVPASPIEVDAGSGESDIDFPKVIGAVVEKDGLSKNVYFDATWESETFFEKTALSTDYTFKLAESSLPTTVKQGVSLPEIKVKSGKYRINGFKTLDASLVANAVTTDEVVKFPATVEAYVGNDKTTTDVSVNWVSTNETIKGGTEKTFTKAGDKISFKAEIVETDKYYLAPQLTEANLASYSLPYMAVYVISTNVAYVGEGGFANLTEAYNYLISNGGSGTIVINENYSYFSNDDSKRDPSVTIVSSTGDNYSDSYFDAPKHDGMIVVKGKTPSTVLEFTYRFYLGGDLLFEDITLKATHSMKERIYANGYNLIMGLGITCTWDEDLSEGYVESFSNGFRIYGGAATSDINGGTNVVLLSGEYYLVRGGNEEGGTIFGDTHVYLGGTAKTYYQLMGGSRRGTIQGSAYVIIAGDAVANALSGGEEFTEGVAVYGGGLEGTVKGDKNGDQVAEGGNHVLVSGGTVNGAVTGSGAFEVHDGKTFVTVCGDAVIKAGEQGAVFGIGDGASGAQSFGEVFINIFCNAKLVARNGVYGNVYGTNTESNIESDIEINVFGNANVEGSVNGGAYVAGSGIGSSYSGKKEVRVSVSDYAYIRLNVYGGSLRKGVYGDCYTEVKGNATVQGVVYGGGQGASSVSESNEYGAAFDTFVSIEGNANVSEVYGGGNYGYNKGNSTVTVKNAVISGNVYGGSAHGGVAENSKVVLIGAKVEGSVYGGNQTEGIIYSNSKSSEVIVEAGTTVTRSVYGGGEDEYASAGDTTVSVTDSSINQSVYGGGKNASSGNTTVNIRGNTIVKGDVYGAGENGNVNKATINIDSGFINNIYGGGYSSYANEVEINISGTENEFKYDISGEINGLPESPVSESDIANNFTSRNKYVLNMVRFFGQSGKTFEGSGAVSAISNFSEVNITDSSLTFEGTVGDYFTGITALNLTTANSKLEFPGKAVLKSAFTSGGVYSTAGTNVLPSSFYGAEGSGLGVPARASTDEEEVASNGKVSALFTVFGKVTGECALHVDGEKKSGTYVTSFFDGSSVGNAIDTATADYLYEDMYGVRKGHNRNFAQFMANNFNTGAFSLVGRDEVVQSGRVFTTIKNGIYGTLDNKNTSNWVIWSAESYANILITKTGEDSIGGSTSPLAGVEFTVYADKDCTKPIETVVTNAKGVAFTSDLLADDITYYIKETKTGKDYTLDETVYSKTLTNADTGKTVSLTDSAIVNYLKYGEISVVKASDDGVLLAGVVFEVTGPNDFSKRIITDNAGFATTGKILYGEYTITEVSNPNAGFVAPDYKQTIALNDNQTKVQLNVVNDRVTGRVVLNKVDELGNALEGVVFNVFADENLEKLVDTITTNSNGYAETKALTIYGESTTYYVVEAKTINGFVLRDDVFEVTLTKDSSIGTAADENDRVIRNYFKKASIAISKKGENDALLSGVVFGIYSDKECKSLVETITTNVSGEAVSASLKLGTYYVKEISNPDKTYVVSEDVYTFELTEHGKVYTKTVYNTKAGAFIALEKVDSYGNPVAGVKFEIRDVTGVVVDTITTDEDGKAISSALEINVGEENLFNVKEIFAPDHLYINDTTFEAVLVNDNEVYYINNGEPIVNNVKEGYLVLEKENENGDKLEGVEFTVYSDASLNNKVGVIVTGMDGKGMSEVLPFGVYYIKETKNPDGSYVIAPDVYTVELNDTKGTVVNGKLIVSVADAPIVNFHALGGIFILKTDEEGKPLQGVEFTIYDANMNAVCKAYTDDKGKARSQSLVISDAVNGTKYFVVETATVKGYKLDSTKYEAVLRNNGEVYTINNGNPIVNYFERGQITISKVDENGNPLAGVEFTIYSDSECTAVVEKVVTDANGKATSSALKLGTYYVKETKAVSSFVPVSTVWSATLTTDGQVKELTEAPIVNYFERGQITISKVDEEGNPLAGVEFTIYSDSECTVAVEKVVTDANGKATSSALKLGTYYVKETKAVAPFVPIYDVWSVTLDTDSEIKELTDTPIVNYYSTGNLTLKKTDDSGNALAGVEFSVYTLSGSLVEVIVTDENGIATSKALSITGAEGTVYVVKETKGLYGYEMDDKEYPVLLKNNGETVAVNGGNAIINKKLVGSLTVSYTAVNDTENQPVSVKVTVNGKTYVGEYTIGTETFETTDGKFTLKNEESFIITLNCGDVYTVELERGSLNNVVSVTYNGVVADDYSGTITENELHQRVDIVASFDIPARPGDNSSVYVFAIVAAMSAFALVVLESKKRKIR